jgi:hypothetical protein
MLPSLAFRADVAATLGFGAQVKILQREELAMIRPRIDFEREFGKLPTDTQTLLLLADCENQPQRINLQTTGWSQRALSYKLPAALMDLAPILDKADLL